MMPEEVLQAAKDLRAKRLFPVHNSKFALANHSWDTPLKAITEFNKTMNQPLITPIIGEMVFLKDSMQVFTEGITSFGLRFFAVNMSFIIFIKPPSPVI